MKIGIVCYPSIGGSGLVATELAVQLADLGHQVHVISYSTPFKLPDFKANLSFHAVDPINYPLFNQNLYTFSLTTKIMEVAEEYELDIVHAHYSIPHSLCAHLAREISNNKFGVVTTLHGTDVTIVGKDKPLYRINQFGIEQSDCVTTVSRFQQKSIIEDFHIKNCVDVVYNFIDTNRFKPVCDAQLVERYKLVNSAEKILMHISNFREPKNVEAVIETFYRVQKKFNCKLVLVGEGPDLQKIKLRCRELQICHNVHYLGKMESVQAVVPLADCLIQPSKVESFGMVLLEAMACSVPTVSSNVDGIPEVIVDNETGFMHDPNDYESMAESVLKIFNDENLAKELGGNGRKRAIEHFSYQTIVPQYIEIYEKALRKQV
ncbi:MAG: N-acetyl-alpha-D-glucosaminyl L-malate synthase BshA [Lentisphaeria bacterium]|nr:N-acetyl-alpha-D-glucosaminyl L-malate synthase BshA [Lentisphaeria bacterium]